MCRLLFSDIPDQLANITDVKWLPKDALEKGVVDLPLNVNETQRNYKIAINEVNKSALRDQMFITINVRF